MDQPIAFSIFPTSLGNRCRAQECALEIELELAGFVRAEILPGLSTLVLAATDSGLRPAFAVASSESALVGAAERPGCLVRTAVRIDASSPPASVVPGAAFALPAAAVATLPRVGAAVAPGG